MVYDVKEMRHVHAFIVNEKDAINEDDHSINFIVSTDVVDRDKEVVMADAVHEAIHRKDEFHANPICLPCHKHRLDSGMPPCVGHWDVDTAKLLKHRVEMRLLYDMKNEIGSAYWNAYQGRHMRAVSIGFRIQDGHEEVKDGKRIYIITKIELYEVSCVGVGANRQALAKLKALGGWHEGGLGEWIGNTGKDNISGNVKEYFDEHFAQLKDYLTEQVDELKDLMITDPDGLADGLILGEQSEPSGRGDDKAEALVERMESLLKNIGG